MVGGDPKRFLTHLLDKERETCTDHPLTVDKASAGITQSVLSKLESYTIIIIIIIIIIIMYHVSFIVYHVSCTMYHVSFSIYSVSCIMYRVSCIRVSFIMIYGGFLEYLKWYQIIQSNSIFPNKNHPFGGTPIHGNPSYPIIFPLFSTKNRDIPIIPQYLPLDPTISAIFIMIYHHEDL